VRFEKYSEVGNQKAAVGEGGATGADTLFIG